MPTRTNFGKRSAFGAQTVETPPPAAALGQTKVSAIQASVAKARWPILTLTFTAFLALVFWFEQRHRIDPIPGPALSFRDCVALGGVSRYLVLHDHQWWRILTAPFLHGGVAHLVGNAITLVLAGFYLERLVGRGWLACLFFAGAVAGSLGSMIYSEETVVSVGASGAIMCLVTVLFALSFHGEAGKSAKRMRRRALAVVIPALLPSAADSVVKIDYGAHFGGFLAGIVLGFLILIVWPDEEATPPWRELAAGLAIFGAAFSLFAAWQTAALYPFYVAQNATLIPSARLAANPQATAGDSADLVERYSHDPLARLLRGTDFFDKREYGDAEDDARTGLSEHEILSTQYAPVLRQQLTMLLMAALWGEDRKDEAHALSAEVCAGAPSDPYLRSGRKLLVEEGACN